MLDRIILLCVGAGLGWIARDRGLVSAGAQSRLSGVEGARLRRAHSALDRLNEELSTVRRGGSGAVLAAVPSIEDVARLHGSALAEAEAAHAKIQECWGRFPSSQRLADADDNMSRERIRLADATIAAVLQSRDVDAALRQIGVQTKNLKVAAQKMRDTVSETTSNTAAFDAVGAVAGLATSFNGG